MTLQLKKITFKWLEKHKWKYWVYDDIIEELIPVRRRYCSQCKDYVWSYWMNPGYEHLSTFTNKEGYVIGFIPFESDSPKTYKEMNKDGAKV